MFGFYFHQIFHFSVPKFWIFRKHTFLAENTAVFGDFPGENFGDFPGNSPAIFGDFWTGFLPEIVLKICRKYFWKSFGNIF